MKIYTKTGDKGETGLIGGRRVSKADLRIVAYGAVDELNSSIGLAVSSLCGKEKVFSDLADVLTQVQNDLFIVGSDLADSDYPKSQYNTPRTDENMASALEPVIDKFESELEPITFFILPGGSAEASMLHVCRGVARRAETAAVALYRSESINPAIIMYLNRLADLLFVAARLANKRQGVPDVAWKKKKSSQ
ncbi:ATP:cob(I)alamin adenosyltransferase [Candidatus Nitrososphaera evergladensis SR1]|jgi:cob(I)alamin adenosyltransferase|uniref:ATP:cob(I)alamin adenosyltransferase n=1 Tax=Candidatus Nitrososphaera evergladensis SR1 TaxID=1459636 RepID=A0A075N020_9ARCH|nr:cob(I)yrinic acid a,c-diamide adenosyltransferase [Candidatus Nitrososphaera evergladensis]AIF84844.1 ATP:cob(I)alamin adenosyltransferase [Candidatus Nitrososphaera evergladensis SR1]